MPFPGRYAFIVGICLIACAPVAARAQQADLIRVYLSQARILKLDRPVAKVIVGDAQIADATVADPKTIVLTGKASGATNLVLLDSDDNPILDKRILVATDEAYTVRVYRQTSRSVLSCAPACEEHTQAAPAAAAATP